MNKNEKNTEGVRYGKRSEDDEEREREIKVMKEAAVKW